MLPNINESTVLNIAYYLAVTYLEQCTNNAEDPKSCRGNGIKFVVVDLTYFINLFMTEHEKSLGRAKKLNTIVHTKLEIQEKLLLC